MKRRALNLEPLGCRHVPGDLNAIGECKSCRQQINEHARLRAEVKRLRAEVKRLREEMKERLRIASRAVGLEIIPEHDGYRGSPEERQVKEARDACDLTKPLKKGTRRDELADRIEKLEARTRKYGGTR